MYVYAAVTRQAAGDHVTRSCITEARTNLEPFFRDQRDGESKPYTAAVMPPLEDSAGMCHRAIPALDLHLVPGTTAYVAATGNTPHTASLVAIIPYASGQVSSDFTRSRQYSTGTMEGLTAPVALYCPWSKAELDLSRARSL